MFEITANDIALLDDESLRALVALLCEAEARRRGLPTSCITWGGDQNAKDGGLDVRVSFPAGTSIDGFIPCPATGFQVKKPDMPRAKILDEMRPHGTLRESIKNLADEAGAYVIVSSASSTSDPALRSRRNAMAEAVGDLEKREALTLEFYDSARIATWVRDHAGMIPWVRRAIGKAIPGWQPYGAWASPEEGQAGEYLLDDKIRVQTGRMEAEEGLRAVQGLNDIRAALRGPGKVVRLVGLSGVGKTRFAQALFDERIGSDPLDPSLAIYTNLSDGPDPQPIELAFDLKAACTRAVLVIDNCPPSLHRRLSEVARASGSSISVLTIEYDIREDEPEGTEVFSLEPSSDDLIEKLLRRRFPHLSQVSAKTISEFSGGNARIAIALASRVGKSETIADLTEEELFQRLFRQRNEHDPSLMRAAQACALVYSFQGEDMTLGPEGELSRLGALIGQSAKELFRNIAELYRRDLVQRRSVWRAVLPHAIANRLAARALQDIPYAAIEEQIASSERLMTSFSRRLSYLHNSPEAVAIAEAWLDKNGYLGQHTYLNAYGQALFNNVVPTAPEAALKYIERVLSGQEAATARAAWSRAARRLRSLAYERRYFERSALLLAKLAETENVRSRTDETRDALVSLFYLYLSGTHATVEERAHVVETLLSSADVKEQELGIEALGAMLEAWHFSSHYEFEFGAYPRDHGYWPKTGEEVRHWYDTALTLVERLAKGRHAEAMRHLLAQKFRGLWTMAHMFDALERICRLLSEAGFWREGWLAVRQTISFDTEKAPQAVRDRLDALKALLAPKDLVQKVRSIVLWTKSYGADLDEFEDYDIEEDASATDRGDAIAENLGKAVAIDASAIRELIPELVSGRGRLFFFGRGLAAGTDDPAGLWRVLAAKYAATPEKERCDLVFRGILHSLRESDAALARSLLDKTVEEEPFAATFPIIQVSMGIDAEGVVRLRRSLSLGKANAAQFGCLAWGRATDTLAPQVLRELLLEISALPGGLHVATDILYMRFHGDRRDGKDCAPELIAVGRDLLSRIDLQGGDQRDDYHLAGIVKACLSGPDGGGIAGELCRKLKDAASDYRIHIWDYDDLLKSLFAVQPQAALDQIFGGDKESTRRGWHFIEHMRMLNRNPIDNVAGAELLKWCDQVPAVRYPLAASLVTLSAGGNQDAPQGWSEIAAELLTRAPNPIEVLKVFVHRFRPTSWSGSRASIMEEYAKLLDNLPIRGDREFAALVDGQKSALEREIRAERERETDREHHRNERFE